MMLSIVGPGLITANIDNDAGGIATYSLAGANPLTILPLFHLHLILQLLF